MDEFVTGVDHYLNSGLLPFYYFIVVITALFILNKFRYRIPVIFIVLIFWEGLFVYLAQKIPFITNVYKIGYALFAFYLYGSDVFAAKRRRNYFLDFTFLFIGLLFCSSVIINESNILTTLSQYVKKYGIPFVFYYGIKKHENNKQILDWYSNLFLWVIGAQVLFVVIKLFLFGFGESLVGSISFIGGAPGNILPVLGFFLLWTKRRGDLSKADWIFIASLLLIGLAGNKRSIWFVLPVIIAATLVYVQKSIHLFSLVKYIPVALVLFVFGVKSNPSLNPEGTRWGSFSLEYVYSYARDYTFGSDNQRARTDVAHGRGGAFYEIIYMSENDVFSPDFLLGHGVDVVFVTSYDTFEDEEFGVASKAAVGAVLQNFFSLGFLGTLFIMLFGIAIISKVKNRNLRIILGAFLLWDYILFYNSTIVINAHGILFVFIVNYYNCVIASHYEKEKIANY